MTVDPEKVCWQVISLTPWKMRSGVPYLLCTPTLGCVSLDLTEFLIHLVELFWCVSSIHKDRVHNEARTVQYADELSFSLKFLSGQCIHEHTLLFSSHAQSSVSSCLSELWHVLMLLASFCWDWLLQSCLKSFPPGSEIIFIKTISSFVPQAWVSFYSWM